MSASAVMSASRSAPCRSSLSLVSRTSRSHVEVSDLTAPGSAWTVRFKSENWRHRRDKRKRLRDRTSAG